ncbi:MAG: xanthine dehydrogenase family protein molybdopterin-binding subunit, partial [Gammaproteobacteria bacterium]|nr:xanthine dehydrogenase family protein molybdopterin-binding subunit [Gammaproteobacteria bacterium]
MSIQISRRGFLKATAASTASLVIGFNSKGLIAAGREQAVLNPFVRIDSSGVVTVIVKHFEMGQGTTTGLTTLIADEMDADWASVKTEFAPSDNEKYKNLFFGSQGTGGSTAMANSYMQYRKAGATARDLLVRAAAQTWGVDEESIIIENGVMRSGSHTAGFGSFIEIATNLEPVAEPMLKSAEDFKLIGKLKLPRKDSYAKTNGTATFAMDVQLPGMVYAVILRSPKFGGTVISFDDGEAKKVDGFISAKALPNKAGVAVYGKNTWAALQSRKAIKAEWDFSKAETRSNDEMIQQHRELIKKPQYQAAKGNTTDSVQAVMASAGKTIEAEFTFPFLAHAPMEPLVCVIEPTEKGVRLHDGCQFPALAHGALAQILGLQPEQVEINTVYAGGSFGRRAT